MTAINPARLKVQTAEIGEIISHADNFASQLHELLTFYSARIRQTSLAKTHQKIQTYQVPEPVIQALETEIEERLEPEPEVGYALVDVLWDEPWIEFRQIAIHVLGILPVNDIARILDRITTWLEECTSEEIRQLIMTDGIARLASERPDQAISYIKHLISTDSKEDYQAALFGLEAVAKDPSYLNLPVLFRILSTILAEEEEGLIKEINALVRTLAGRSEQETTYFLITQLDTASEPRIFRVVRQVIDKLSQDNQILLRKKLESVLK
jgi:hypothetical protein